MTSVCIIHVGELKEKYYADAVLEYEKRIGAFARLTNVEIKESRVSKEPSEGEIRAALLDEGKKILQAIPPRSYVISLCVEGKRMSSEALARCIADAQLSHGRIAFIIGSSHGLDESVKKACDIRLSVSDMTFPHRLMRVILAEQIYRAFAINAGLKYHK